MSTQPAEDDGSLLDAAEQDPAPTPEQGSSGYDSSRGAYEGEEQAPPS